jgi:hypothetical protein
MHTPFCLELLEIDCVITLKKKMRLGNLNMISNPISIASLLYHSEAQLGPNTITHNDALFSGISVARERFSECEPQHDLGVVGARLLYRPPLVYRPANGSPSLFRMSGVVISGAPDASKVSPDAKTM